MNALLRAALVGVVVATLAAAPAIADLGSDLEAALTHALAEGRHAELTEENELPASGPASAPALVFLIERRCVELKVHDGRNDWSLGPGCDGECRIGPFTSPLMPGEGLICRVARQDGIEIITFTPPAENAQGALLSHVEYRAKVVDVARWTQDPAYVAIWKSYGLDFERFHAYADFVKTDRGWIPYE